MCSIHKKIKQQLTKAIEQKILNELDMCNWVSNFLLSYPCICLDTNIPQVVAYLPDRNIAPCITQSLCSELSHCQCYSLGYMPWCVCDYSKHMVKSNVPFKFDNDASLLGGEGIFGDYYNELRNEKLATVIRVDESHASFRAKCNMNQLNYSQILTLWQSFYDKKMKAHHNRVKELMIAVYNQLSCIDYLKILTGYLSPQELSDIVDQNF